MLTFEQLYGEMVILLIKSWTLQECPRTEYCSCFNLLHTSNSLRLFLKVPDKIMPNLEMPLCM